MDTETQKPFACKTEDCGMSFTNEDHLTVHEKKHEMILNLAITDKTSGAFIADQTPTPTRLIKNCEEVGLFDDLKHVNPFDETFRRAVESKNDSSNIDVSSTSEGLNQTDESLHTPQVFPTFDSTATAATTNTSSPVTENAIEKRNLIATETITIKPKKQSKKTKHNKKSTKSSTVNILPTPNSSISPKPTIVPATTLNFVPVGQIIALSIPRTAIMQRPMLLPKIITAPTVNASQSELSVKDLLKANLSSPRIPRPGGGGDNSSIKDIKRPRNIKPAKSTNQTEFEDDGMERRRAASLRYRRKIKREQTDLKRRNSELITENSRLRSLVNQLKQSLWAYQNGNESSVISSKMEQQTATMTAATQLQFIDSKIEFIDTKLISTGTAYQIPLATPIKLEYPVNRNILKAEP